MGTDFFYDIFGNLTLMLNIFWHDKNGFYLYLQVHDTSIHITAVVVEYKTRTGRTQRGVATNWLKLKKPDNGIKARVPIYVRKSQFRLPFKSNTPVIMIGPGTGLAPFRGFIQERFVAKRDGKHFWGVWARDFMLI